ncbi:MAG: hypothetical protein P8078_02790 [bacterium]
MKSIILFVFLIGSSYAQTGLPSDSGQTKLRAAVTLSTVINPKQIPLNRTARLIVRLTWKGDIDYIEINQVEEPILSNLEIVGSSASNKIVDTEGGVKAIKEISYILKPVSLGMGYVETVSVSYDDKLSGKTYHLNTKRIGVEAIAAIPEKGEIKLPWIGIAAVLIIMVIGGTGIYYFYKKRIGIEKEQKEEQLLEEKYLKELKKKVDLSSGDKNEAFTILSKFFRTYLSEKYSISALETTTDELMQLLSGENLEEELINKSRMLFSQADVVKFSGKKATQAELDGAYTAVETILETHLASEKKAKEEKKQENRKSEKRLLRKNKKDKS